MSKILKKISASLMLILMLFSVAFNVISYAVTVQNNENGTYTITSNYFKLILNKSTYDLMSESKWKTWLSNYDSYCNTLKNISANTPNITGLVTIDTTLSSCTDSKVTNAPSSGWQGLTWANSTYGYNIELLENNFQREISNISNNIGTYESYTLLHEICHLFEYSENTNINFNSNIGAGPTQSPVWSFENEVSAMLLTNELIRTVGISGIYNGGSYYNSDYEWYSYQGFNNYGTYAMKYRLAAIMIEIKEAIGLSSFTAVNNYISSYYREDDFPTKIDKGSSERFNLYIDVIKKLSTKDAWQTLDYILSTHNGMTISTIATIMNDGGKIGTLENSGDNGEEDDKLTTSISSITVKGNKSNKSNTIDFTQDDTKATITVVVNSNKQPKSILITIGGKAIVVSSSTKSGDNYTFTTTVDISTISIQENLIKDKKVYVVVTDANGETIEEQSITIDVEEKAEEEKNENITDIVLMQGGKLIVSGGKVITDAGEEGKRAAIDWDSNEKITLQFKVKATETRTPNVGLTGYTAKLVSSENGTYKYEFEKDDEIEEGTTELTLSIQTNKNGSENIKGIPIINTGADTLIISRVHGEMKEDGRYYIYIELNNQRDEKYTLDWCKQYIKIIDETGALELSNAMNVSGSDSSIAFEVLNPADEDVAGNTFKIKVVAEKDGDILDEINTTIKIGKSQFEEYTLIIADESNLDYAQNKKGDYEYAESNDGSLGFDGAFQFWKTKFVNNKGIKNNNIYCIGKGEHYNWHYNGVDIINFYNASEYQMTKEERYKYGLIYLNEMLWPDENAKYYAIQAYIWTTTLNEGHTLDLYNEVQESYIPYIEDAIEAAGQAVDNGGTLTLRDGTQVKIKDFTATYFKWIGAETIYGTKVSLNEKDRQPFFTFDYDLGDGPGIQLVKVNEEGEILEGATFKVAKAKYDENGKRSWTYINSDGYITNEEGFTEIIPVEEGEYFIHETKSPDGYKPTTQYVIVTVDSEGNCEYKVYEVSEDKLENGYVTGNNGTIIEIEGEEELDWVAGEVEEGGLVELQLIVINKNKIPGIPPITIIKTDQDGKVIAGKGGKFEIRIKKGNGITNVFNDRTLDENGQIKITREDLELAYPNEELKPGDTFTIEIKEIDPPDGYEMGDTDTYTFTMLYTEENDWIFEDDNDPEFCTITNSELQVRIKNIKKKDLTLQIQKIDGATKATLANVRFSVTINGLNVNNAPLTTQSNGISNPITIGKDKLQPGIYIATVTETQKPSGYEQIDTFMFSIIVGDNGKISVGETTNSLATVAITSTEDSYSILITVENNKEDEKGARFPLLMYIEGTVWLDELEGKNSEADGYLGNGSDKLLEGIEVRLYESDGKTLATIPKYSSVNDAIQNTIDNGYIVPSSITEHAQNLLQKEKDGEANPTKTDDKGKFSFYGLDPAKTYIVEFRYNGMRYEEIKTSTTIGISGYDITRTDASKAIEDSTRRAKIIKMFSEIGPYPNNYIRENGLGNLAFTQTEVEEYLQSGKTKLPNSLTNSTQMDNFIEDTKITATITINSQNNLLLTEAENKVKEKNKGILSKYGITELDVVYPVVVSDPYYRSFPGETAYEDAKTIGMDAMTNRNQGNIGFYVQKYQGYIRRYTTDHFDVLEETGNRYMNLYVYQYKGDNGESYERVFSSLANNERRRLSFRL